jgi:hypothetical protein
MRRIHEPGHVEIVRYLVNLFALITEQAVIMTTILIEGRGYR